MYAEKYARMRKYGVPENSVRRCMIMDGVDDENRDACVPENKREDREPTTETNATTGREGPEEKGGGGFYKKILAFFRRRVFRIRDENAQNKNKDINDDGDGNFAYSSTKQRHEDEQKYDQDDQDVHDSYASASTVSYGTNVDVDVDVKTKRATREPQQNVAPTLEEVLTARMRLRPVKGSVQCPRAFSSSSQ